MIQIDLTYEGELRTRARHGPSGSTFITDAPVDNHGKGESFSPTDLVATALGSCMLTVMGIYAERHDIDMRGAKAQVSKIMSTEPPRRIARLEIRIEMPLAEDHPHARALALAVQTCPVYKSILPEIEVSTEITWQGY